MVLCMSENMSFWKTGENGYVVFMSFLDQIYVGWKNTLSAHCIDLHMNGLWLMEPQAQIIDQHNFW